MSRYLISFPSGAMDRTGTDLRTVAEDAHAVVAAAKAAGVWVFGGGIDESVPPVRVAGDGTVTPGTYPQTARIEGGYSVLDCADRDAALAWAARFAAACRCAQEVRVFGDDPES
ncbi:YciI family protein [Demequina sp. SYSU T00068]|uniref:YciI family protein n=1 Tax=Demequina lignilytica TaxID=3051663 RepID=UPI002607FDFC|nr:YciI family protein [Demequina sp. SYSU T00068]MDN4490072.1 YciI family protein [Demequina sp. SYSU T00068]